MTFDLLSLLLAAGAGFFAASIGALNAFIFTGFMCMAGTAIEAAGGGTGFLSTVAFGPVFGPHVAFAGGVGAAAYAARTGKEVGGKDIGVPLAGLGRPDVQLVGALFGMFGYVVQIGVSKISWFGTHTDSVAFTVILSAMVTRILIGRMSPLGQVPDGAGWGRFSPTDTASWVRWHEKFVPNTVLGLLVGLMAASITLKLAAAFPHLAPVAQTFMFGISAASLLFLSLGLSFPVTHHITLIAGLAALTFLPTVHHHPVAAALIGAVAGMLSAWCAEFFARIWHDHGNTHIDPPAAAIWPMTTLVLGLGAWLN